MTSEVEICSLALGNIRAGSINDIDEPTFQAQQCKLRYPVIRNKILRDHDWSFANRIEKLELLDLKVPGWCFAYSYPVKCLKINRVFTDSLNCKVTGYDPYNSYNQNTLNLPLDPTLDYKVINVNNKKVIVSNAEELSVDYRLELTNTEIYPDDFIVALSHLLAADLAIPIVGGKPGVQYRQDSYAMFNEAISMALSNDTSESHQTEQESDFVTVRR